MSTKRDVYVEKLKAQLDEWNSEIDKLAAVRRNPCAIQCQKDVCAPLVTTDKQILSDFPDAARSLEEFVR